MLGYSAAVRWPLRVFLPFVLASMVAQALWAQPSSAPRSHGTADRVDRAVAALGKLPLRFVENRGVFTDDVAYFVPGAQKSMFFTTDGVSIVITSAEKRSTVKLCFDGARSVRPTARGTHDGVFSYFRGPRSAWRTGLKTWSEIVYADLWPGIDLVYRGSVNRLKYAFVVRPGADPSRIRLCYRGADRVVVTPSGSLRVETPAGAFEDARPEAYQSVAGERRPVSMAYDLHDESVSDAVRFGYEIGEYDPTVPLILDPAVVVYSGFIGGGELGPETVYSVAVDAAGNLYVCGETLCSERAFPVKVGPDLTYNGGNPTMSAGDAFVAKVNAAGTALIYCGYIGGSDFERAYDIAIDAAGNAYVCGLTSSTSATFPVKRGPDLTYNGALRVGGDGFVARVNAAGTDLDYCGYVGGSSNDAALSIAVDASGSAIIAGQTYSTEATFPVKIGPDVTHNGGEDGFVAKVSPSGSSLVYCGYIGGAGNDWLAGVDLDPSGRPVVVGSSQSTAATFPVRVGPDLTPNGGSDAFVARVSSGWTALDYCGYIGGASHDAAFAVAIDANGAAHIAGAASSDEQTFPVKVGPDLTFNSRPRDYDGFVAKLTPSGADLVYCGYIGGDGWEQCVDIALDAGGAAYVVGTTFSDASSFPVRGGPSTTYGGNGDCYVAVIEPDGTELRSCGYFGGPDPESANGIALDGSGNLYSGGLSGASFPTKVGPDLSYNGGGADAFVIKFSYPHLGASGSNRPGGAVQFTLTAKDSANLPCQFGTSLGLGPSRIGSRRIGLAVDGLLLVSVSGLAPRTFRGYAGRVDAQGSATATVQIPNLTALIGVRFHTAALTQHPASPSGVKDISNTVSIYVSAD